MTTRTSRLKLTSTLLTLVVLILVWQLPDWLATANQPDQTRLKAERCLLNQQSCTASGAEQSISLKVSTDTIRSLTPLPFVASLSGMEAESVTLVLEGKEMFMGVNQVSMSQQHDGSWHATTELAVCTTGKMVWLANVIIERTNQQPIKATFEFEAH